MIRKKNKAIFLDRDGVINKAYLIDGIPHPPKDIEDLHIIRGVSETLKKLKTKGFLVFVITNQPDVARGTKSRQNVERINSYLMNVLPIDEFQVCYHDDIDKCSCRKPKPGLIHSLEKKYNINLEKSFVIGDRWKDIEAGKNAKCKTIFIDYGYNEKKPFFMNYISNSLEGCLDFILKN